MIIQLSEFISFLPLLVLLFTVILLIIFISFYRHHLSVLIISILGLSVSGLSLFLIDFNFLYINKFILFDRSTIFYTSLLIFTSITVCFASYNWLSKHNLNSEEFYILLLISILGCMILILSNHMITFFLSMELMSLPIFGLIGYVVNNKYSLNSSIKYIILSSVSSSFLLFGIAILYALFGNLNFIILGNILNDITLSEHIIFLLSILMILVSISLKLSLFPFHLWTKDIFEGLSLPVSFYISTLVKFSVLIAFLRLLFCIPLYYNREIFYLLYFFAFFSIIIGNIMALFENSIQKIIGYSSISHVGYAISIFISLKNFDLALETIGIYFISYILSSIGFFTIINHISNIYKIPSENYLSYYRGLFWKHPILSLCVTFMVFSLLGIPLTVGFIGKFYILMLIINSKFYFLILSVIVGSVLSLYYYLRIIINFYLPIPESGQINNYKHNMKLFSFNNLLLFFLFLIIFVFGIYPKILIDYINLMYNI
ncbi:NADH-quinone oxidoreductase subunit N [Buchnera aphidicola (Neophyllaphis podocarpi)]|uniref:NADH-quinone oxidoreductase subunit N n=1 Tax=Buchnera aphidicola TaxID=9 RepID=UPI0031B88BCD